MLEIYVVWNQKCVQMTIVMHLKQGIKASSTAKKVVSLSFGATWLSSHNYVGKVDGNFMGSNYSHCIKRSEVKAKKTHLTKALYGVNTTLFIDWGTVWLHASLPIV